MTDPDFTDPDDAPNGLYLAWYEGFEQHHGDKWHRCGWGFYAKNDDGPVQRYINDAANNIVGPSEIRGLCFIEPVKLWELPK